MYETRRVLCRTDNAVSVEQRDNLVPFIAIGKGRRRIPPFWSTRFGRPLPFQAQASLHQMASSLTGSCCPLASLVLSAVGASSLAISLIPRLPRYYVVSILPTDLSSETRLQAAITMAQSHHSEASKSSLEPILTVDTFTRGLPAT